jgi:hypothetical protein
MVSMPHRIKAHLLLIPHSLPYPSIARHSGSLHGQGITISSPTAAPQAQQATST